jgi:hypothetical protein
MLKFAAVGALKIAFEDLGRLDGWPAVPLHGVPL